MCAPPRARPGHNRPPRHPIKGDAHVRHLLHDSQAACDSRVMPSRLEQIASFPKAHPAKTFCKCSRGAPASIWAGCPKTFKSASGGDFCIKGNHEHALVINSEGDGPIVSRSRVKCGGAGRRIQTPWAKTLVRAPFGCDSNGARGTSTCPSLARPLPRILAVLSVAFFMVLSLALGPFHARVFSHWPSCSLVRRRHSIGSDLWRLCPTKCQVPQVADLTPGHMSSRPCCYIRCFFSSAGPMSLRVAPSVSFVNACLPAREAPSLHNFHRETVARDLALGWLQYFDNEVGIGPSLAATHGVVAMTLFEVERSEPKHRRQTKLASRAPSSPASQWAIAVTRASRMPPRLPSAGRAAATAAAIANVAASQSPPKP